MKGALNLTDRASSRHGEKLAFFLLAIDWLSSRKFRLETLDVLFELSATSKILEEIEYSNESTLSP